MQAAKVSRDGERRESAGMGPGQIRQLHTSGTYVRPRSSYFASLQPFICIAIFAQEGTTAARCVPEYAEGILCALIFSSLSRMGAKDRIPLVCP